MTSSHIIPALDGVKSRPYLLSSYTKQPKCPFSMVDVDAIEHDLMKAIQFLKKSDIIHGSITEDTVLIEKVHYFLYYKYIK